jgi:predicted MPP superfamily phosphohydrolase
MRNPARAGRGAAASALFVALLFSCKTIRTASYALETPALAAGSFVQLVVSDLHSTVYGTDQSPLLDRIAQKKPDLILLTGDIYDDSAPDAGARLLLQGICRTAPVFYVTGNHEYWRADTQALKDELESFGAAALSDQYAELSVRGNAVIVAGVDDPDKRYAEPGYRQRDAMRRAFEGLSARPGYKILLAHRPERIADYAAYPFDMVVSGHVHGGQARILNGLYAPNQGFFPKYAGGLYAYGALTHIVSRGLSFSPKLPRIGNPPELVFIAVKSNLCVRRSP